MYITFGVLCLVQTGVRARTVVTGDLMLRRSLRLHVSIAELHGFTRVSATCHSASEAGAVFEFSRSRAQAEEEYFLLVFSRYFH